MDRAPYAVCRSLPADAVTAAASGTRPILVLCGLGGVHKGHEPDRATFRANADVPLAGTLSGQRRAGIIATALSFQPARHSHRILPRRGTRSANQLAELEHCARHGSDSRIARPCLLSAQPGRICGCFVTDKTEANMHSDDIAISLSKLSKTYRLFGHPGDRIKQFFSLGMKQYHHEFTAIEDISIDIKQGEAVGIIGRNGSGKSTLLQLICGILKPTSGVLQIHGRVSALLELGTGFNPEFTGRENVYFQGAIMGFTQEQMKERFDTIASFADIADFMDQPVRSYSSGMYMRLAFSVAIHVQPNILVVDEALSVGDVVFQHKSMQRARELVDGGTTLLLVSHDRNMITAACRRCLLLDKGRLIMDGQPADVFDYYLALNTKGNKSTQLKRLDSGRSEIKSGTGEAGVERIRLLDDEGNEIEILEIGMPVTLEFTVRTHQIFTYLKFGIFHT